MDKINDLFLESVSEFVRRFVNFIPNIIVMFLIILIGVILSNLIKFILIRLLGLIKFDGIAEQWGISKALAKGGVISPPSRIVASVSYWGIFLIFFLMGFIALDVAPINDLVSDLLSYLPIIIAAAIMVIFGFIIGDFIERAVLVAAGNAGIVHADLIGKGVKLLIVLMAISMALDQLGIARGTIIAAFSISFGGIVFAISLAFGLGAKDMAKEFLEKRLKKEIKTPAASKTD